MLQHTSAYVSIRQLRQHTSAHVSTRQHTSAQVSTREHSPAYVSIREDTAAYLGLGSSISRIIRTLLQTRYQIPIRLPHLHTEAYVSIRHHTSAYVSIRQHTDPNPPAAAL